MQNTAPATPRRNRVILLVAGLTVLLLVALASVAWWRGRAVTIEGMQRALAQEPETYEDLKDRLGMVVAADLYFTVTQDKPDIVKGYADHPELAGRIHWFDGRGGRAAATQVQFAEALENPWQHGTFNSHTGDAESLVTRSYCIYMNSAGRILGWADVTGGPQVVNAVMWARASGAGKDPQAKRAE